MKFKVLEGGVGGLVMPTNGMVFYAPLKENSATAVTGQSLTTTGTITYQTYKGIPCASLDGSSWIEFSDNGFPNGTNAGTISLWFNITSFSKPEQCLINYGLRQQGASRSIFTNGYITFAGYAANIATSSSIVSTNKWYNVVCVKNGSNEYIYLNGTLVAEGTSSKNTVLGNGCIGHDYPDGNNSNVIGYIAAARIYNRVLTTDEITLLSREFDNAYVDKNTILYIPMYGDNPFEDKSRNAYQVTNYNVTAVTDEHPEKSKGAGYFSANGQYLYINSNILSGLTTFTLDFDYKLTSVPTGGNEWQQGYYFAANGENYANPGCDMYFATSQILISFDDYSYRVDIPYTPDTNWHKLKITRDASNLVSVYQDNNLLKSYTESRSFYTGNYGFAIGRVEPQGEGGGAGFHGYIANYRISNIVRVVENKLDNSSLMFSLDAKKGLQDNSSNPCTLENHGVTTSNDCFVFDGSSYITTNQASKLNLGTGDFTIEIVMNLSTGNSSKNYPTLIGGKDGWNTGANGIRWNGTHHRSGFAVFLNPSDPLMRSNTTFTPNDGTFITYVLQRNAGVWSQYFDGVKDSTTVNDSREYDLSHSSGMSIGCSTWDGENGYHVGLIKSIKIWNKAKYL